MLEGGERQKKPGGPGSISGVVVGSRRAPTVICVIRCMPDGETACRISSLASESRISSLCHECEQVGLTVSIDTHHSFPAIILSMTDTRERRRPPLRAFTADPTHPRVPVQACPSGVTKLGTEYSCSAAEALIRLIPRRFSMAVDLSSIKADSTRY